MFRDLRSPLAQLTPENRPFRSLAEKALRCYALPFFVWLSSFLWQAVCFATTLAKIFPPPTLNSLSIHPQFFAIAVLVFQPMTTLQRPLQLRYAAHQQHTPFR